MPDKKCDYFDMCKQAGYGYCPIASEIQSQKDKGSSQMGGFTRATWEAYIARARATGGTCSVGRESELQESFRITPDSYKG